MAYCQAKDVEPTRKYRIAQIHLRKKNASNGRFFIWRRMNSTGTEYVIDSEYLSHSNNKAIPTFMAFTTSSFLVNKKSRTPPQGDIRDSFISWQNCRLKADYSSFFLRLRRVLNNSTTSFSVWKFRSTNTVETNFLISW